MRKLRIGIIDLVSHSTRPGLWSRVMNANCASIMPQVVACWAEALGHEVTLVCYTGFENLREELPQNPDLIVIGAFTETAQLAYALSKMFQSQGAVTAIGGPHALCYPQDSQKYFDYVIGFTDQPLIQNVLQDCSRHRPMGVHLSAARRSSSIPGIRERWKFVEATLRNAPVVKIVPMLGSLGCPYTCSFCIDAAVPYQPIEPESIREDLKFLLTKYRHPYVVWHDPNFGVRFNEMMGTIEQAVPAGRITFIAESTLSILSEPHVVRMKKNGFKALLPGIESWYDLGEKARTGNSVGMDKVRKVADQVAMILRHVPYVQTNFVMGLDGDQGPEPFELTKKFLSMTPGAFPVFSMLTAFGQAVASNLEYQRAGRVLPFPFHLLNNSQAMNVRVKNYTWPDFYSRMIDLTRHAYSPGMVARRLRVNGVGLTGWLNVVRAFSSEGSRRIKLYREVLHQLEHAPAFRAYFEQESTELPSFYSDRIREQLGSFWEWLPEGALYHDPNAYLKSIATRQVLSHGTEISRPLVAGSVAG